LEYPGALWHVTSRGNERKAVFADDDDCGRFVEILGETVMWAGWRLHAYVLMGNHYHLLVETPDPTLSRGMRQLNGVYTQYFNFRHRRSGHLFQGRFKGILVEKDAHLTEMIRYIVLNPVRAKLCRSAKDWRWSSYWATAGLAQTPAWLHTAWTWRCFSLRSRAAGQAGYRAHVNGRRGEEYRPWRDVEGQIYLGGDSFRESLAGRTDEIQLSDEIPRAQRSPRPVTMDEILAAVAITTGTQEKAIRARHGEQRAMAASLARACRLPLREIGGALNINPRSAAKLIRQGRFTGDAAWCKTRTRCERILEKSHPGLFTSIPDET
jgi:REP element-mobilizing transposase RayT